MRVTPQRSTLRYVGPSSDRLHQDKDMSRLPLQYAGKIISFRLPFTIAGTLDVPPNTNGVVFPDVVFSLQIDKPFEIHRMFVRLAAKGTPVGFSSPTVLEPQPTTLEERVKMKVQDVGKNENQMKSAAYVSTFINRNTGTWEWEEPYTIVRSEGFQVQVDTDDFPNVIVYNANIEPELVPVTLVRVAVTYEGFLVIVGPPSETR